VTRLPGFQIAWTGLSLENKESGNQATLVDMSFCRAAIFLALAALYESWSIPLRVMLAMRLVSLGR